MEIIRLRKGLQNEESINRSCIRSYVIVPRCSRGFQDPGHKTSSQGFRVWRGAIWHVRRLRADSVVWLSHSSSVWPWSGAPKVRLYNTFLGSLRHVLHHPLHWGISMPCHSLREHACFWFAQSHRWFLSSPACYITTSKSILSASPDKLENVLTPVVRTMKMSCRRKYVCNRLC